jgi:hypothetical protein
MLTLVAEGADAFTPTSGSAVGPLELSLPQAATKTKAVPHETPANKRRSDMRIL